MWYNISKTICQCPPPPVPHSPIFLSVFPLSPVFLPFSLCFPCFSSFLVTTVALVLAIVDAWDTGWHFIRYSADTSRTGADSAKVEAKLHNFQSIAYFHTSGVGVYCFEHSIVSE